MTDFLFATPNFINGMASAIDLGGTLTNYNASSTPDEADMVALSNDWIAVGNDIREAVQSVSR